MGLGNGGGGGQKIMQERIFLGDWQVIFKSWLDEKVH